MIVEIKFCPRCGHELMDRPDLSGHMRETDSAICPTERTVGVGGGCGKLWRVEVIVRADPF